MAFDLIERQIGQPHSGKGSIEDQFDRVEDQRPVDANTNLAIVMDQPPSIDRARRRQPQIDPAMAGEIVRRRGTGWSFR